MARLVFKRTFGLLFAIVAIAGCSNQQSDQRAITQISTINALMIGRYDGLISLRELLTYGDFGIGTFDQLHGEMIVLDGKIYQATSDGSVRQPNLATTTPLAVVAPFRVDRREATASLGSLAEIEKKVDSLAPGRNTFAAIRLRGQFESITFRSVPRQEKPYPPLTAVVKRQSVWTRTSIDGTLVGLRCPRWVNGVNVPGYHWHFISDDRTRGGHVIAAALKSGEIACGLYRDWLVKIGDAADIDNANFDSVGKDDLESVERLRSGPAGEQGPR